MKSFDLEDLLKGSGAPCRVGGGGVGELSMDHTF